METKEYQPEETEMKGQLRNELIQAAENTLSRLSRVEQGPADRPVQGDNASEVSPSYAEAIEREQFFSPEAKAESNLKRMMMTFEEKDKEPEDDYPYSRYVFRELYKESARVYEPDKITGVIRLKDYPSLRLTPDGDLSGSYKDVRAYLLEQGLTGSREEGEVIGFEAHHLLEDRFMEDFGISRDDGIAEAIYSVEHMQLVHGKFGVDFQLPHGFRYDIKDVVEGHIEAYQEMGRPEWGEELLQFIRHKRETIIEAYKSGRVSWATPEDVERVHRYLNSL